ncbi:MAG TPA: sugar ABC transporter permease [Polyangiaceae bacterium]
MAGDTRQAVGRKAWIPYAFLAPYAVFASIYFVYPFLDSVGLAFYQTNGPRSRIFVGLDNFAYLASDDLFYSALINTTVFACASVLVQLPLSMGLALLLNSGLSKSKGFFRLILFSPNLVGQIFVGILFSVLFTPRYGLVNRGFQAVIGWGLEQQWLDEPKMAMPALILTSLWLWVGFNMVYFLAALQTVDKTLEEAARIDGANAWQVFFHVTLPSMRHVVVFVLIMSIIGSFQLFELPLAMFHETHGLGPENSAITLIMYLNRAAFELGDLGLGAAVGWFVTLVIMGVSLIQLRLTGALKE